MWLSEQFRREVPGEGSGFGVVTISGQAPAAMGAAREERLLPVISPGGYAWLPESGAQVMVLRDGAPCILGQAQPERADLEPGDVMLYAGNCAIILRHEGKIELTGRIFLNGTEISNGESTE